MPSTYKDQTSMTTVPLLIEGQWYGCHCASALVRETAERWVETGSTPQSTPWLTRLHPRPGYLAQDPRYYEDLTARQTMRFVAEFFYDGPRDAVEHRIEQTLELVGLDDKSDRPIKGFSGGERQRLGIAQAQVNYPDLLI